jgi:hypothetical protein
VRKTTTPRVEANGMWNHFTGMKKWTITCGECEHSWQQKVPIHEICSALCPCCGAQNKWSAKDFEAEYNARFGS